MIEIVPFQAHHLEQMLPIAREWHAQSLYFDIPLDEEKLVRQLAAAGTSFSPDRYFRLAVEEGDILGALYGCSLRTFFSPAPVIKDLAQWTRRPTARNAWALLLSDFERWGREQGASLSSIGYHGTGDIELMRRVFEMQGYRVTGYNTVKELRNG